jgi:hypothetical protein
MADNLAITQGAGTNVATDEIGGAHYQRVKATWGPDGTANDVDTATGKRLPVQSALETSVITNVGASLTPKFAKIAVSSSGANEIVTAVTSKKIRVLAWEVAVNAAVNFKWQSDGSPTDLTGLYYTASQGQGVARAFNPVGYFETVAGEALDLNLSGAVAVGGSLVYVEV